MRMRNLLGIIIAIGVAALLLFMYVVPTGVAEGEPTATITIYLKDINTDVTISGAVVAGEPSNSLSILRPSTELLTTFYQQVSIYPDHEYAIWLSVDFSYTGANIMSWDSASVEYSGKIVQPESYILINDFIAGNLGALRYPYDPLDYPVVMTTDAVSTSPITMTSTDPFDRYYRTHILFPSTVQSLLGENLDGATLYCTVSVEGTDTLNRGVTGTVSATLVLSASTVDVDSSISVTINDMSSGIEEG